MFDLHGQIKNITEFQLSNPFAILNDFKRIYYIFNFAAFKFLKVLAITSKYLCRQARSQPVFSGKPGMVSKDHFVCPVPSFSEMKEIG